jgi:hypothetical protein
MPESVEAIFGGAADEAIYFQNRLHCFQQERLIVYKQDARSENLGRAKRIIRRCGGAGLDVRRGVRHRTGCSDMRGCRPSVDLRKKMPAGQYSESLFSLCAMWGGGESGT